MVFQILLSNCGHFQDMTALNQKLRTIISHSTEDDDAVADELPMVTKYYHSFIFPS